eukprot:GEMP01017991.1.p1 GENE.GEMP01017991.1~~GEMP01017991.1.p1  ORF type:complete len:478 (+),score=117.49 GEMP01017991.1:962-2395(+)
MESWPACTTPRRSFVICDLSVTKCPSRSMVEAQLDYTRTETKITELDLRRELARVDEELAGMIKGVEGIEIEVLELKQQHGLAEARIHFVPPPLDTKEDYAILETMQKKTNDMNNSAEVIEKAVRVLKMDVDEMKKQLGLGQRAYDYNQAEFLGSSAPKTVFTETGLGGSPTIFVDLDASIPSPSPGPPIATADIDPRLAQPEPLDRPAIGPASVPPQKVMEEGVNAKRRKDAGGARSERRRRHRSRSPRARTTSARRKRREDNNVSQVPGGDHLVSSSQRLVPENRPSVGPHADLGEHQRIVVSGKRPPLPDWSQERAGRRRRDERGKNDEERRHRGRGDGRRHRHRGDDEHALSPGKRRSAVRKDVAPSSPSPSVGVKQSSRRHGDGHRSRHRSRPTDELRQSGDSPSAIPPAESRRKRTPRKHQETGERGRGMPHTSEIPRPESRKRRTPRKHREKGEHGGRGRPGNAQRMHML